ncbi:MAG: hypothetical protein RL074_779 [Bacteroidota bacterium]
MTIITALFFGFISAVVGILPPGLINMTAAKVDIKEGKRAALWFVIGAVIVIFFQVYLALLFAQGLWCFCIAHYLFFGYCQNASKEKRQNQKTTYFDPIFSRNVVVGIKFLPCSLLCSSEFVFSFVWLVYLRTAFGDGVCSRCYLGFFSCFLWLHFFL